MYRIVLIFIILEVRGRGAVSFRITKKTWTCHHFHGFGSGREGGLLATELQEIHGTAIIFMVLEVDGGAAGFRIIRDVKDCHYFHVFGSGLEGGRLALES